LGVNNQLGGGFLDAGGSGSIQAVGGLTALCIAWILGPRRGKYGPDGTPAAIPGHNAVLVLFGCLAALVGWLGLNCAGSILYYGVEPGRMVLVAINTTLGAGAAALASAAVTRTRFGKPDASLCANGWVGGLAAGSAGCAFVVPVVAVLTGAAAGILVVFAVEWIELHLSVDDPGGAVAVHAAGGIWGVIAVGLFGGGPGQLVAQLAGLATLLGCILPLTYGVNRVLDRFYRQRVAVEGERRGMDLFELGAGAYPEFMTHTEDFTQR
jgi:Amt family ammonium transporter